MNEALNLNRYYVRGGAWDALVDSPGTPEAATSVFEEQYARQGKEIKLSPTITVINLSSLMSKLEDCESALIEIPTPEVLADAGLHSLSKKFKRIISDDK